VLFLPTALLVIADFACLVVGCHQVLPSILYQPFFGLMSSSHDLIGVFGSVFYLASAMSLIAFSPGFFPAESSWVSAAFSLPRELHFVRRRAANAQLGLSRAF
jgi:hypothetical protein